jgi:hypothetical protein
MLGGARILVTIAACMAAIPVAAQAPAPTTTAFDGTYVGVSRTFESRLMGTRNSCALNSQLPGPLTIANGVARYSGSATMARVNWPEASVNAQGVLVMACPDGGGWRCPHDGRLDAQIDARGTVTGRLTGGGCSYHMIWQKEDK